MKRANPARAKESAQIHYADVRIMPMVVVKPLVVGVDGLGKSA